MIPINLLKAAYPAAPWSLHILRSYPLLGAFKLLVLRASSGMLLSSRPQCQRGRTELPRNAKGNYYCYYAFEMFYGRC